MQANDSVILYDDMKGDEKKSHLKYIFSKGRNFSMTFIISKQTVNLLPEYDYCPDCSLTWVHLESGIVNQCNVCHGLGQIKKESDNEIAQPSDNSNALHGSQGC